VGTLSVKKVEEGTDENPDEDYQDEIFENV